MMIETTTPKRRPSRVPLVTRYMWQCPGCQAVNFSYPAVYEPQYEARFKGMTVNPNETTAPDGVMCAACERLYVTEHVVDEWVGEKL